MTPTTVRVAVDHPAFDGHFPGRPLLPGVALLAIVVEAALADPTLAARLGPAPRLANAKFLAPVRPGDTLALRFDDAAGRLAFEVRCGDRGVAVGRFEAVA